jgi:hypothetical protein
MKRYRLTKEAVPFFAHDVATDVRTLDQWKSYNVDEKALEEVKPVYVTYGFRDTKNKSVSTSGWANPDGNEVHGSHFYFTLHFPSTTFYEHDKFAKGKIVRELMDKIQSEVDWFYEKFDFKQDS